MRQTSIFQYKITVSCPMHNGPISLDFVIYFLAKTEIAVSSTCLPITLFNHIGIIHPALYAGAGSHTGIWACPELIGATGFLL